MSEQESKNENIDSDQIALGQKLKLLRESRGYTIEDVAGQLYLDNALIIALESGNYQDIPSKAYVKGYIRNFIKLFDAITEFESFDLFETDSAVIEIIPISLKQKKSHELRKVNFNNLFYLVIICIFLGGLYFLEIEYGLINKVLQIIPLDDSVSIINDQKSEAGTNPENKSVNNTLSKKLITSALVKSDSIKLRFNRDSWTQVKDAKGKKLISRFVKSGKVLKFRGKLPFTVTLGNSKAVKISVNGNDYNQSKYNKKEIAHFVIDNANLN